MRCHGEEVKFSLVLGKCILWHCELREPAKCCGLCALCLWPRGSLNAVWVQVCLWALILLWMGACCEAQLGPKLSWSRKFSSLAISLLEAHVACRLTLDYPAWNACRNDFTDPSNVRVVGRAQVFFLMVMHKCLRLCFQSPYCLL